MPPPPTMSGASSQMMASCPLSKYSHQALQKQLPTMTSGSLRKGPFELRVPQGDPPHNGEGGMAVGSQSKMRSHGSIHTPAAERATGNGPRL